MSASIFKSIVGIDASQPYPYSMRRPMATRTYTRWGQDLQTSRVPPGENKIRSFENIVKSYFERSRPDCKIESFYTTGRKKKIDCSSVDAFCSHCNTVFEGLGCFHHTCPSQDIRPPLTEENIQRGSKKRELHDLRRSYIRANFSTVFELLECESRDCIW